MNLIIRCIQQLPKLPKQGWRVLKRTWRKNAWNKIWLCFVGLLLVCLAGMYGIAQWYILSNKHKPTNLGTTFVPAYAESLGLEPQQTMDALLNDLHVKHFRLVSYWDQIEPSEGNYDFSQLDWQFKKAEEHSATVTLSLGLRQPRWPECHMPAWALDEPKSVWQPQLERFMQVVIDRYKDSPSLASYQLENEYFLTAFGTCTDFSRDRLESEYGIVKRADPDHPVIISRSNNVLGLPLGDPRPDEFGVSIYKRVWSPIIGRYVEYPFPAWFYAFMAGSQKIVTGKDTIVHELQAEAWPPNGQSIMQTSLDEQNKSFDAQRFKDRIEYGKATGMHDIYVWGSEYWYYRLVIMKDPSLWDVAKQAYAENN
jgi:hypothetical protein